MDTPPPPDDPKDLFLRSLDLIKRIVEHACRRSRLRPEDKEEFLSWVYEKLIEDDYAIIRRFEGRDDAKFPTYLATVIQHLRLDYQRHLWGKFHPSAEAVRLGPVAVRLEQLTLREGFSFDEACQFLRINEKVDLTVAELEDLWAKLPYRTPRQIVGEEPLRFKPSEEPQPDQKYEQNELAGEWRRHCKALGLAMDSLSPEDRLLIKMWLKFKISDISRFQKVEQKPLYRRVAKAKDTLLKALERHGVRKKDARRVLNSLLRKDYDGDSLDEDSNDPA